MGQTFFFRINLNKFGEIKVQAERERKTFRNAVIAFAIGFLVLVVLMITVNSNLSKKVESRKKFLNQTEAQLKTFETGSEFLSNADLDRLSDTFNNRIFWAKKMVALGNEITDKLAVSKLSFSNGILTLNGITPINSGVKELDLINEFINRLKANPEISNDFPQIKSGQISKQITKDTAIMEFVIECYSRETQKKEVEK